LVTEGSFVVYDEKKPVPENKTSIIPGRLIYRMAD
jgi:hypothetical protein